MNGFKVGEHCLHSGTNEIGETLVAVKVVKINEGWVTIDKLLGKSKKTTVNIQELKKVANELTVPNSVYASIHLEGLQIKKLDCSQANIQHWLALDDCRLLKRVKWPKSVSKVGVIGSGVTDFYGLVVKNFECLPPNIVRSVPKVKLFFSIGAEEDEYGNPQEWPGVLMAFVSGCEIVEIIYGQTGTTDIPNPRTTVFRAKLSLMQSGKKRFARIR